jgi:predicted nucleotidyltransferase
MSSEATILPELAGTKEAAAIFGVRTQNFLRDWAKRPDFPAPVATLAATPVWRRDELDRYRVRSRPIPWPPRRRGLRLSPAAERWLPVIRRRLVRDFHPDRIILFGSQARGEPRPDSDIDLLVVVPSDITDTRALAARMRGSLRDVPMSIDIVITTADLIARYGTLVGTVLRPALLEGVTLHARR